MADAPIVVIDYHKGNLSSVARGLVRAGWDNVLVSDDPQDIAVAAGLVLPGVGSFFDAITFIRDSGQERAIVTALSCGVPLLGICLGLQVLFARGDEGVPPEALGERNDVVEEHDETGTRRLWVRGLGLFSGSCTRLESARLKVPHVGWDQLHVTDAGRDCPLLAGVPEGANVYFTHSYAVDDDADPSCVAARTHYVRSFPCVVWGGAEASGAQANAYGCQFHPEKSSGVGLAVLRNFVDVVRGASPLDPRARMAALSLLGGAEPDLGVPDAPDLRAPGVSAPWASAVPEPGLEVPVVAEPATEASAVSLDSSSDHQNGASA